MKVIKNVVYVIFALSVFLVTLISSIEIAAYSDYGFYEKEYDKCNVLKDVNMQMDDVIFVTKEMMSYLRGNRKDLVVNTVIGGEEKEFFNDREKSHMADCRVLFVAAIWLRRFCIVLIALTKAVMCAINHNKISAAIAALFNKLWKNLIIIFAMIAGLVLVISIDFDKAFTTFHEIFFDNDLWLLDPNTDNLICILPQTFFIDICIRIGIIFAILMFFIFAIAFIVERVIIKRLIRNN